MEMIVNITRILDHDQPREFSFGNEESLRENLAIAYINPKDFEKLGLVKSLRINIRSKYGDVILNQAQNEKVPEGTILIPVSIWSNQITGIENNQLINKNIKAIVEPTRDPVLEYKNLILKIKK